MENTLNTLSWSFVYTLIADRGDTRNSRLGAPKLSFGIADFGFNFCESELKEVVKSFPDRLHEGDRRSLWNEATSNSLRPAFSISPPYESIRGLLKLSAH